MEVEDRLSGTWQSACTKGGSSAKVPAGSPLPLKTEGADFSNTGQQNTFTHRLFFFVFARHPLRERRLPCEVDSVLGAVLGPHEPGQPQWAWGAAGQDRQEAEDSLKCQERCWGRAAGRGAP